MREVQHVSSTRVLISRRPLCYLGIINIILVLLFGPITQDAVALPIKQRPLGNSTGTVSTSVAYTVANHLLGILVSVSNFEVA